MPTVDIRFNEFGELWADRMHPCRIVFRQFEQYHEGEHIPSKRTSQLTGFMRYGVYTYGGCRVGMGSWTRVTFDPGARTVETVRESLQAAVGDTVTGERYGNLVWQVPDDFDHEQIVDLDVPADRVLVAYLNDTSDSGTGYLYKRHNDEFVLVDRMSGASSFVGRDVVDYFVREHDFVGFTPRNFEEGIP